VQKAVVVITRDGVGQQQELPGNVPVLYADGSEVSVFEDLVNHVTRQHMRAHDQWEEAVRKGEEMYGKGKVKYVATGDRPEPRFNGQKVYVKGISYATGQEELLEIANVIVTFEAQRTVADVPLTHGEYDGTYFSTGSAALGTTPPCSWSTQRPRRRIRCNRPPRRRPRHSWDAAPSQNR
jgi:hypothetical protein